jgi:dipeptidyl aminopeptidase/acylaminoacyl peptidase
MKNIRWLAVIRLTGFTLVSAWLILNLSVAWVFVTPLIAGDCIGTVPLVGIEAIPERVTLRAEDGTMTEAWYYPSENGRAVIALGGTGGSLGQQLPPVRFLIEAGYGVLQIGSRACANPPSLVTLGHNEVQDALAAVRFLAARDDIHPGGIGVFGYSMGGVTAIRAAARDDRISAVVAEGGYHNLGEDIVEPGSGESLFRKAFLYAIAGIFWLRTGINPWNISPIEDLPTISPRPVLLIYGEQEIQSGRGEDQFSRAKDPRELWVVPGGAHGTNNLVEPETYVQRVITFFEAGLEE